MTAGLALTFWTFQPNLPENHQPQTSTPTTTTTHRAEVQKISRLATENRYALTASAVRHCLKFVSLLATYACELQRWQSRDHPSSSSTNLTEPNLAHTTPNPPRSQTSSTPLPPPYNSPNHHVFLTKLLSTSAAFALNLYVSPMPVISLSFSLDSDFTPPEIALHC